MAKIRQPPVPDHMRPVLKKLGITMKAYRSAASFEKDLQIFMQRNEVMHLCTQKKNAIRSTPVGYRSKGLSFYILSEGGGKFANLKENKSVSFSIAEPFKLADDFWGYKGLQAWGKAKVYSRKDNPKQFEKVFELMDITVGRRKLRFEDLSLRYNHKIIEIKPKKITYTNPRAGVLQITWEQ
ncbi:pyridoxamine 5'-phosphate oxidase family protein [Thermodesulfobacteriota bacterium]